jgi:hypothetical protein
MGNSEFTIYFSFFFNIIYNITGGIYIDVEIYRNSQPHFGYSPRCSARLLIKQPRCKDTPALLNNLTVLLIIANFNDKVAS